MEQGQRLSKQRIQTFTYGGGWDVRWDTDVTGLGVRVYPSGKKSFVLSYRAKGGSRRKHLIVLGPVGVLTLDQARAQAKTTLASVIQGTDPASDRRIRQDGATMARVIEAYLNGHAKPHKRSWRDDERRLTKLPRNWLSRLPAEIKREEVRALHLKIGAEAPYEANRLLALLRVLFKFAQGHGLMSEGLANPAQGVRLFKEQSRKRFAKESEAKALLEAVEVEPNPFIRAMFWLYLLTGARREELLTRRWEDVDWELRRLRLPMTKSGQEQHIPLNGAALDILRSLPHLEDNPFIFPGARKGRHFVNIAKPWRRLVERAGVQDLRLHDLRRTVGSWLTQSGVDLNTVKSTLRHSNISTTLVYARLHDGAAAEALERHGEQVLRIGGTPRLVNE